MNKYLAQGYMQDINKSSVSLLNKLKCDRSGIAQG
jgi:hypothetical protein